MDSVLREYQPRPNRGDPQGTASFCTIPAFQNFYKKANQHTLLEPPGEDAICASPLNRTRSKKGVQAGTRQYRTKCDGLCRTLSPNEPSMNCTPMDIGFINIFVLR
jgi:hypothetical protein